MAALTWKGFLARHKGKGHTMKQLGMMYRAAKKGSKLVLKGQSMHYTPKKRAKARPKAKRTKRPVFDTRITIPTPFRNHFTVQKRGSDWQPHAYLKRGMKLDVVSKADELPRDALIAKIGGKYAVLFRYRTGLILAHMRAYDTKAAALHAEWRNIQSMD